MLIRVDAGRCTGHALCAGAAPTVIVLDEDGYNITETVAVQPGDENVARKARDACPERAITIIDDM